MDKHTGPRSSLPLGPISKHYTTLTHYAPKTTSTNGRKSSGVVSKRGGRDYHTHTLTLCTPITTGNEYLQHEG